MSMTVLDSKEESSGSANIASLNSLIEQKSVARTNTATATIKQSTSEIKETKDTETMKTTLESKESKTSGGVVDNSSKEETKKKEKTNKVPRRENGLRRGKWTAEEEAYANRLIHEFKLGLLPLTDGTTLRTFLSKLLHCDPMRISKKFVGSNCIGKQVFRRRQADMDRLSPEDIQRSRYELAELERRFLTRVAHTNRTTAKASTSTSQTTNTTSSTMANTAQSTTNGNTSLTHLPGHPNTQRLRHQPMHTDAKQPDFIRQQPVMAPWLLPPHASGPAAVQSVRAGAGAVAIAAPYGLGTSAYPAPVPGLTPVQHHHQSSTHDQNTSTQIPQAASQPPVTRNTPQSQHDHPTTTNGILIPNAHSPKYAYHSTVNTRTIAGSPPTQWLSPVPSDAFRYTATSQQPLNGNYRPGQRLNDRRSHSPNTERDEAEDELGRLEDIGTGKSRLERHRSDNNYAANLPTHPSHASLTSFDLPSFNSMDNLAILDTGNSIGFNSPWPSSMNLAAQSSVHQNGMDFARQPSETHLHNVLDQQVSRGIETSRDIAHDRLVTHAQNTLGHNNPPPPLQQYASSSPPVTKANQQQHTDSVGSDSRQHHGPKLHPSLGGSRSAAMASWPSFSALVGIDEAQSSPEPVETSTKDKGIDTVRSQHTNAQQQEPPPDALVITNNDSGRVSQDEEAERIATTEQQDEEVPGAIVHRHPAPEPSTGLNAEISRQALKSSPKHQIRRQNRNSSVENFLSLVQSGDIPAPEEDLLSSPILQQIAGDAPQNAASATRKRTVR